MHAEAAALSGMAWTFLLLLVRMGALASLAPVPGFRTAPEVPRLALALGLTVLLYPSAPPAGPLPSTAGPVVAAVAAETAFGIALGAILGCLGEAFTLGAQVLGLQAGYSYASTIDPASQADSSVLQILVQLSASLMFFALGIDRQVVSALAGSLRAHPPGVFALRLGSAWALIELGAEMLRTAVRLAMPVLALLLMIDLSLALVGRIQAQLQLLSLAFPVKMLAALVVLAATATFFPVLYRRLAGRAVEALFALGGS